MFSYLKNKATDGCFSASTNSPKISFKSNRTLLESATAITDTGSFVWVNSSGEIVSERPDIEDSPLTPPPIGSVTKNANFSAITNSPKIGFKSNRPLLESTTAITDTASFVWVNSSGEIVSERPEIEASPLTPPSIGSVTKNANASRLTEPSVIPHDKINFEPINIIDIRAKAITENSQTIRRVYKLMENYRTDRIQEILDTLEKKNTCQASDTTQEETVLILTKDILNKICSTALIKARELTVMINKTSITNDLGRDVLKDSPEIRPTKEYIENLDGETHILQILSKTASALFMNAESWNREIAVHRNGTSLSNRISFLRTVDKELDTIITQGTIVDTHSDNLKETAEKLIKKLIADNAKSPQNSGMAHSANATTVLSDIQHEKVTHRSNTCPVFNLP